MLSPYWFRTLRTSIRPSRSRPGRTERCRRVSFRPHVEGLEDRTLLSPYVVTTTADSGFGSLRDAITQVNADTNHALYASPSNPNVDEIDFNIPSSDPGYSVATGAFTIAPQSSLPAITNSATIDGYTQPGSSPNTLAVGDNARVNIRIDGSQNRITGLLIEAGSTTVQGLDLQNLGTDILLENSGMAGDTVVGNFLGTDGSVAFFDDTGVLVVSSGNTVGGASPGARNVIDSNGWTGISIVGNCNTVQGNYVGVGATGNVIIAPNPDQDIGIYVAGGSENIVGGTASGAGNVVSGWDYDVQIGSGSGGAEQNYIEGNLIGTNAADNAAGTNMPAQLGLADYDGIGGAGNTIEGNVISGINTPSITSQYGALYLNAGSDLVQGNWIGTNPNGDPIPNACAGVVSWFANTISGNTIAFNAGPGVWVNGTGAAIEGNSIYANGQLGIVLGLIFVNNNYFPAGVVQNTPEGPHVGANDLQNYPVLAAAYAGSSTAIVGTFNSTPNTTFTLDFYGNHSADPSGYGQGQFYLGSASITTDNSGNASFVVTLPAQTMAGEVISATATDQPGGNTSEFSADITAQAAGSNQTGEAVVLSGGANAGTVQVSVNTSAPTTFTPLGALVVEGSTGAPDAFTINFGSTLTTPIDLFGSGNDTVTVNGSTDPNTANYIVKTTGSQNSVTWGPSAGSALETMTYSGIQTTNIYGGAGTNYITDPGSQTNIFGGPGVNTITITATSGSGVVLNGGPGTNNYIIDLGSLAGPVTINNPAATAANSLTVNSAANNSSLTVSGSQVAAGSQTVNVNTPLTNLALNVTGTNNSISLVNVGSSVAALSVSGSSSTQVQVQGTLPAMVQAQNVPPLVSAGQSFSYYQGMTWSSSGSFAESTAGLTFAATVNYGDGSGTQPLTLEATDTFTLQHAYAQLGTYTVTVSVTDSQGLTGTGSFVVAIVYNSGLLLLDPSGKGALNISGSASLVSQGGEAVVVNSINAAAALLSGNASATAAAFDFSGAPGYQTSGSAHLDGSVAAAAAALTDPLASLPVPAVPTARFAAVKASGNTSLTLQPGTYVGGISISGNAAVTLLPGIYYLQGGGLSVSGNGKLTGSGVLLYNAPQSTSDGVTIAGNGSVTLSPATSGVYAGVTVFQDRTSAAPITISGNGDLSLSGMLYAAWAEITVSGNGMLTNPLDTVLDMIAYDLVLSGHGSVQVG